jgi:hypothetical protein
MLETYREKYMADAAWKKYGRNLRGERVVVTFGQTELIGTVVTHLRDNQWLIQFAKRVPPYYERATFHRREFRIA